MENLAINENKKIKEILALKANLNFRKATKKKEV